MGRDRVVDDGADALPPQPVRHGVPAAGQVDHILVPAAVRPGADPGFVQAGVGELGVIPGGQAAALGVELLQVGQLDPQQPGLQFIQPAVGAHHLVLVAHPAAVVAEHPAPVGQVGVVGGDAAGVPEGPAALGGVKAETAHVPQAAHHPVMPVVAVALGAVLHHFQVVAAGNVHDLVHVAALAVEMHRQDGFGAGGDGSLDLAGVDVVILVRLHKDRRGPVDGDAHDAGNVGVGADDDLVPRPNVQQAESDPQSIQSRRQAHAMLCPHHGGPFLLKGFHLAAQDVPSAA